MRILGLDPGSIIMGYGVVQLGGRNPTYIASGSIRVDPKQAWGARLKQIFTDMEIILTTYQPEVVAVEQVFMHNNAASALKLGQARGVAMVACANQDLPIAEYAPRAIKQAVVGYGNAKKHQVQHMIRALLQLDAVPQTDAADALAVALCHSHHLTRPQ